MTYLNAAVLLEDEFGWTINMNEKIEQTGEVKITKPDDEVEYLTINQIIQTAKEMWQTAKDNNLDPEYVTDMERVYDIN